MRLEGMSEIQARSELESRLYSAEEESSPNYFLLVNFQLLFPLFLVEFDAPTLCAAIA